MTGTAQPSEAERLARIEEQITGVREDVGEIKSSLKDATAIMSQLHISFVPRSEIEKIVEARNKEQLEQDKQIKALWRRVDNLSAWRNRLVGAVAVIVFALTLMSSYLRDLFMVHK